MALMLTLLIICNGADAAAADTARMVAPDPYADFMAQASQRFDVPTSWLRAIMQVESAGNPKAVSPKGAMGLMQLMPETWATLRIRYHLGDNPFDPYDNILGGAAYLRELFDRYGASGFLAAYNAGPKRFEDYLAGLRPLRDETKRYVSILERMLPDLQLSGIPHPVFIVADWQTSSLFAGQPVNLPPPNTASNELTPTSTTTTKSFALSPQSNGLFVPVRMPDQR
ncbi:MAG: lytic transglycosylase domain-containing protein [Acidobacteria bacterium]|nr:lytic transglycosylase domain-containing protein [Acidobacteriota bacterium]